MWDTRRCQIYITDKRSQDSRGYRRVHVYADAYLLSHAGWTGYRQTHELYTQVTDLVQADTVIRYSQ
jgi:hypothetical protein